MCIAIAGVLGTWSALAIAASAPGNAVRARGLAPRGSLLEATAVALDLANRFIGSHIFVEGASLLLVAAAGAFFGATMPRLRARTAGAIAVVAIASSLASFIPSTWLISAPPPPRAQYVASFFFITAVFAGTAALTSRRRNERAMSFAAAALLLLAIVPLWSAVATVKTIPEARRDAVRRETIMRLLSTQRGKDVVLRSRWALESRYLGPDATDPNTYCIGSYYGLRSLRVVR